MFIKEEIKETAKHIFRNHKASVVVKTEDMMVIDWKQPESSEYCVQYILDSKNGTLHISGDMGYCISCWHSRLEFSKMVEVIQTPDYWIGKFKASSDRYTYNDKDIKEDLCDIRDLYVKVLGDKEYIRTDFDEMYRICLDNAVRGENSYTRELIALIEKYDDEWYDDDKWTTLGKRLSPRISLWALGLKMAWEQIKE